MVQKAESTRTSDHAASWHEPEEGDSEEELPPVAELVARSVRGRASQAGPGEGRIKAEAGEAPDRAAGGEAREYSFGLISYAVQYQVLTVAFTRSLRSVDVHPGRFRSSSPFASALWHSHSRHNPRTSARRT